MSSVIAGPRPNPEPVENAHANLRKHATRALGTAAQMVGGSIRGEETVIGSREGVLIALAPLHGVEGPQALTYLSFPSYACAATLPPGFYTIEFIRLTTGDMRAVYRNLAGQVITALPAVEASLPPTAPSAIVATSSELGQDTPCSTIEGVGTTYLDLINLT
jgi:hypothetical protein